MAPAARPHLLGIDDGAFAKGQSAAVPVVGVMMEGAALVESVSVTAFPVDGAEATGFLAEWVAGLRLRPSLQGVVLGGITIAGLGVVDTRSLAARLALPVLSVTRRRPDDAPLVRALRSAGLDDRVPIVDGSPQARLVDEGLFVAHSGIDEAGAAALIRACVGKARLPEPLRVAHLVARGIATGESRGRV